MHKKQNYSYFVQLEIWLLAIRFRYLSLHWKDQSYSTSRLINCCPVSRVLWELYYTMGTKWELSIKSLGKKGPMGTLALPGAYYGSSAYKICTASIFFSHWEQNHWLNNCFLYVGNYHYNWLSQNYYCQPLKKRVLREGFFFEKLIDKLLKSQYFFDNFILFSKSIILKNPVAALLLS